MLTLEVSTSVKPHHGGYYYMFNVHVSAMSSSGYIDHEDTTLIPPEYVDNRHKARALASFKAKCVSGATETIISKIYLENTNDH